MKKSKKVISLICAMLFIILAFITPASAQQPAQDSDSEMIYGADIGWLSQMESQGITWVDDNGNTKDPLVLLQEKGVNAVRLRVFVDPPSTFTWTKPDGTTCYLGYNDTQGLLYSAKRAKDLGMKVMVVFHYSDHFADPLYQDIPNQWAEASATELEKYLYDYTYYIMNLLKENGITPDWVQVGNEVSYGVLYPYGRNSESFEQMTAYLNSGYDAVKAVSPETKVITHLTHGSGIAHFKWFFENFITNCGGKTDVIGLSYYPYWTGGNEIENVAYNLYEMASKYGKEVIICETGEEATQPDAAYELLRKEINAIKTVPNNKGVGVFYWEPEGHVNYSLDGYTLGATEEVSQNVLRFTSALNAFSSDTTFLSSEVSFELLNYNSQKCLNVASGSSENSAVIEQYGYSSWDSQKWVFEEAGDDYYYIKNKNSGKVLEVPGFSKDENTPCEQYDKNDGWNQMWSIETTKDGKYMIKNRWSGLYLGILSSSINDGAYCAQMTNNSTDNVKWYILVTE